MTGSAQHPSADHSLHTARRAQEYRALGLGGLVILAICILFTRDLFVALRLGIALVIAVLLPGFALLLHLLPDERPALRALLGFFLGMGPGPVLAWLLSLVFVPAVSVWFGLLLGVLALGSIEWTLRARGGHTHHAHEDSP